MIEVKNLLISQDLCGPRELWHLEQKLPVLLFRDFVKWLPPELVKNGVTNFTGNGAWFLTFKTKLKFCQSSRCLESWNIWTTNRCFSRA